MPKFHSAPNYEYYMKKVCEMTEEEMLKTIEDSIVGDGSINKSANAVNYKYSLTRTEAHKDNLFTMAAIMEFITPGVNINYRPAQNRISPDGVAIRSKPTWIADAPISKIYTYMRELYYKDGKKCVPNTYLENFDLASAASLYVDDGTYHKTHKYCKVYVNGFDLDDVQKLQLAYIDATGLSWSIITTAAENNPRGYRKGDGGRMYSLSLSVAQTPEFFDMIEPFVDNSYLYKINRTPMDRTITDENEKQALATFIKHELMLRMR